MAGDRYRIVFMGTPEFAVPALDTLVAGPHDVCAVVSQPDRRSGRGRKIVPAPVKVAAQAAGIRLMQPEKVNTEELIRSIRQLSPDLLVVVAYGQILPAEFLDIPCIMPINIHGSLLPAFRGAAPIHWAMLEGCEKTGITIMKMDTGVDTGPMLLQESIAIGPDETFGSLYQRMAQLGARLVDRVITQISRGKVRETPQPEEGISHAPPIKKEMARVDWTMSAARIHCLIRAMDPMPGAYTIWKGERLRVYSPALLEKEPCRTPAGTVCGVTADCITVSTGEGCIALRELQWPGRKRLASADFLRGRPITVGEKFG